MRDPPGQYDDAKVPQYTLPDPLLLLNGKKVASIRTFLNFADRHFGISRVAK
jgi:hypothetical protein